MKAISIRNPHANLLVRGPKDIETRNWKTNYRGPIAIHVAKTVCWDSIIIFIDYGYQRKLGRLDVPTGVLVARGELIDIVKYSNKEEFDADYDRHLLDSKFYQVTKYGWVISNIIPFVKPIPYRGRQGLFEVDINVGAVIPKAELQLTLDDIR